jgi:hypothetical protein
MDRIYMMTGSAGELCQELYPLILSRRLFPPSCAALSALPSPKIVHLRVNFLSSRSLSLISFFCLRVLRALRGDKSGFEFLWLRLCRARSPREDFRSVSRGACAQ